MAKEIFDSIWFALKANEADAINMSLRSGLIKSIEMVVAEWNLPQAQAAKRIGLTRPRLNDLLRGKISKFKLDALAAIAHRAGLTVKMSVRKSAKWAA